MVFFMEKENNGVMKNALNKIQKNLFLLFHIMLITGFTIAMAGPELPGEAESESAVFILDRSVSMQPHMDDAKDFILENTGRENTLIVLDDDVEVVLEHGSSTQLEREVSDIESLDTRTNTVSAIEFGREYSGDIYIASDMRQTVDSRSPKQVLNEMERDRNVEVMELTTSNSHGIVDLDPGIENTTVEVANFENTGSSVELSIGDDVEERYIDSHSTEQIVFEPEPGSTELRLDDDGFQPDNRAFLQIPEDDQVEVGIISDRNQEYLKTALDVNRKMEYTELDNPLRNTPEVDFIVVGNVDNLFDSTESAITEYMEEGTPVLVMAQESFEIEQPNFIPWNLGEVEEHEMVDIHEPVRTSLTDVESYELESDSGESFSTPENSLIIDNSRSGELIFYNLMEDEFRYDLLYPVFWSRLIQNKLDYPTVEQLNHETGSYVENSDIEDRRKLKEQGFHEIDGKTTAVNILERQEFEPIQVDRSSRHEVEAENSRNVQNLALIILLLLIGAELSYLRYVGELR